MDEVNSKKGKGLLDRKEFSVQEEWEKNQRSLSEGGRRFQVRGETGKS